jgi:hypothetical protein
MVAGRGTDADHADRRPGELIRHIDTFPASQVRESLNAPLAPAWPTEDRRGLTSLDLGGGHVRRDGTFLSGAANLTWPAEVRR